jgi:hypothetical protein
MRLARVAKLSFARFTVFALRAGLFSVTSAAHAETPIEIWADRDDDDFNGLADGAQPELRPDLLGTLTLIPKDLRAGMLGIEGPHGCARLLVEGKPFPWGKIPGAMARIQGVSACNARIVQKGRSASASTRLIVRELHVFDSDGSLLLPARDHLSLSRLPPQPLTEIVSSPDNEDVRFLVRGPEPLPAELSLESISWFGQRVDVLKHVALQASPCPPVLGGGEGLSCASTAAVRLAIDEVDRQDSLLRHRSLVAELGGAIVARIGGMRQVMRVLGPRLAQVGPIGRLRATLRPFVLRVSAASTPAVGSSDAGAVAQVRAELAAAARIWAQCGISFGDTRTLAVSVVDPPGAHLVSIGDGTGIPATGGEIALTIDQRRVHIPLRRGTTTSEAAARVAHAVTKAGFGAVVSPNARTAAGAVGSVDVLVRRKDGRVPLLEGALAGGRVSSDATLAVSLGAVDLEDGLEHFSDVNAAAGTLEERALLKSLDDGDPTTIEVVVVPFFSGGGRIGESFIASDRSSLRNMVVTDRAGVRARRSSLTLAHELGHVLLDMPGHPDDYGTDTPTKLMDSDASDASPFGPRRLSVGECLRAYRQSGPKSGQPMLREWPLGPVPVDEKLPTLVR